MDLKEYISSGILEAYALGELPLKEKEEVERMLVRYPELREELAQIEETLQGIAFHTAVLPKSSLKEKVLARAFAEGAPAENIQPKVVNFPPPSSSTRTTKQNYNYLLAASVFLAVLSSFAAVFFWNKWQNAEDRLYLVLAENTQYAQHVQSVENKLEEANKELAVYFGNNFNQVQLEGLAIAPDAKATVYWNQASKEVYLNPNQLPAEPSDKQYQLWAIVDGKPVDIGVVARDKNQGLIKMKNIEGASAFAITLEPKGGSKEPTLDQMYVLGKTS